MAKQEETEPADHIKKRIGIQITSHTNNNKAVLIRRGVVLAERGVL